MNIEEAREYCLSLKNVTECFPFDDVSLVFKVEGKMFLLLPLDAVEPCVSLEMQHRLCRGSARTIYGSGRCLAF